MFVKVDDEDYDWLIFYNWTIRCSRGRLFYAYHIRNIGNGKLATTPMHRAIMGTECANYDTQTDHIDRNGLNNQKNNLRNCTPLQNRMNSCSKTNCTSGYKGVNILYTQKTKRPVWLARLKKPNGKFLTATFAYTKEGEVFAALQYNDWAQEYFGEFAYLNKI